MTDLHVVAVAAVTAIPYFYQPMKKRHMKNILSYLKVALELTGLDSLMRGLGSGAASFFNNFLSDWSSLMLVGVLIRPAY
jgi:putative Mn2+ efflux pump MntP